MNKIRRCPICMYEKNELLYTQKFAEHFEHKIVSCLFCGFVYMNNAPSQKYYDEYYKNQSKYDGTRQHETHDKFTYKTLEYILKKFISKEARILDVGCSTGRLLNFIKTKGYKNLLGVEPAPNCKEIAKNNFGISIVTSTLDNFNTSKKYNLIIFSQVFEHIVNLRDTVIKAHSLLSKDGLIFIGVPDAENFYKKGDEPFGEFSTEHINFYTKFSLQQLLARFENLYYKSDNSISISLWKKGSERLSNFMKYIDKSKNKMSQLVRIVNHLPKRIIVWGTGALTEKLLKATTIKNNIFLFVDSDSKMWGKYLEGIKIISPDDVAKYNDPILIASYRFKDEIKQLIKKRKLKNRIITF